MSRRILADELTKCAALWPSLRPDDPATLEAFWESLAGFTEDELRAGFKRVRQTHEGVSFPKPATLVAMCGAARNRQTVVTSQPSAKFDANGCEEVCALCHTVTLYHEATEDGSPGRLWPWHNLGCRLTRPDQPRDAHSRRIVWPQPNNGGLYRAPEQARALIATHANGVTIP